MKPWEHFRLVSGYLPEIDHLPQAALEFGLPYRVAAVLNNSAAAHCQLYWDPIQAFAESLGADSIQFEIDTDKDPLTFGSISSMRRFVEAHPQGDYVFARATFCIGGVVHAFIDVEPWAAQGGPFPYSDSWTFAIYRATNDMTRLRDTCYRVCTQHKMPILDEICGLAEPRPRPRWKRFLYWLIR